MARPKKQMCAPVFKPHKHLLLIDKSTLQTYSHQKTIKRLILFFRKFSSVISIENTKIFFDSFLQTIVDIQDDHIKELDLATS